MAKVTIYLPDELAAEVKDSDLNSSAICQRALREALHHKPAGDHSARLAAMSLAVTVMSGTNWNGPGCPTELLLALANDILGYIRGPDEPD